MARQDAKEHNKKAGEDASKGSGDTHSGTPNPVDPTEHHPTEHKSGYGGEGGAPRKSSDQSQGKE